MKKYNEKIPGPEELEKEIGNFLTKKFGQGIKVVTPAVLPHAMSDEQEEAKAGHRKFSINFDLKPEQLIAYLDQYIIKQDSAKSILATKICTHFNRIKRIERSRAELNDIVGLIKNNILMIGPTGVGKTYMIKLIARKIGVPFIKGDATKFSETGYVGGDVEDLVRDLVREADGDIELAQYGIIYIDEIDKIASSHNVVGADVSRTGVQRALLKPLEETEVDLKVPHDPIAMIQEIEQYRKTGKSEKRAVNTKNILFIVSGAFSELVQLIRKRIIDKGIGFGARISTEEAQNHILQQVKSEDLIQYGFESEFVGRLPVRAVFDKLTEDDLYSILRNPNNPILLGKKLDFDAYGIRIKFEDAALRTLARQAYMENTGARGLVSAVEKALLYFEKTLPSIDIQHFPVTNAIIDDTNKTLRSLNEPDTRHRWELEFDRVCREEKKIVRQYIECNKSRLGDKHNLALNESRIDTISDFYCKKILDIDYVITTIKSYYDHIKQIELQFFKNHDINIVFEEDAIDFIIEQLINDKVTVDSIYNRLTGDFQYGLKLIIEKTGKNRFFISREALKSPEAYINNIIRDEMRKDLEKQ